MKGGRYKIGLQEKFNQMTKARKIFISISIILGIIAIAGFVMVAVGVSYSFPMLLSLVSY